MHSWLSDISDLSEVMNEGALQRMLKFNKTIRKYVKQPSPTIFLCEENIRKIMQQRGNFYVLEPFSATSRAYFST